MGEDENLPPDPMSQLATGAAQQHELFMAWVNAGFTRAEAMQLLLVVVEAGIAKGPGSG
jgi:hypothetical protein